MAAKIINGAIPGVVQAIRDLSSMELPFTLSLQVARAAKELEEIWTHVEKHHHNILDKFAEKDEAGNFVFVDSDRTQVTIPPGRKEGFTAKVMDLYTTESEVQNVISESSFPADFQVKPTILIGLGPILL
jgi:hypothetical protein